MTLLEKLNKELSKVDLKFESEKEFMTKYKGTLVDTKNNIKIPFQVQKCLRYERTKEFATFCRDYADTCIKLKFVEEK